MTRPEKTYWKRRESVEAVSGMAISGWCHPDDVPSYGTVGDRDLPAEVHHETDANGTLHLLSPLIFGTRRAYRLRATVSVHERQVLAEGSLSDLRRLMRAEFMDGPEKGARRTNWWWAYHDRGWRPCLDDAPARLLKAWTGPLLDRLTQDHPDRAEILSQWQGTLDAHNAAARRRRPSGAAGPRKADGTPVVAPRQIAFRCGTYHQHFVLGRHSDRGRLYPFFRNTRMKTPHGPMLAVTPASMTDRDLTAHLGNLAGYIATVHAAALALKAAMPRSAHDLRAFARTWEPVISDWAARPITDHADGRPDALSASARSAAENGLSLIHSAVADIYAAERALQGASDTEGPVARFAMTRLLVPAQAVMKQVQAACPVVAEAE